MIDPNFHRTELAEAQAKYRELREKLTHIKQYNEEGTQVVRLAVAEMREALKWVKECEVAAREEASRYSGMPRYNDVYLIRPEDE